MSLTVTVKDELALVVTENAAQRRAEVSAMLRFAGGLHIVSGRIVVEAELDKLVDSLLEVAARRLPADKKLITYIYMRLHAVKTIVFRNGTLRASFFRDIWRVKKARKKFDLRKTEILRDILNDGLNEGLFSITDVDMTAYIIHHSLKGLEVPYIRGHISGWGKSKIIERQNVTNIIFNGIKVKHNVY